VTRSRRFDLTGFGAAAAFAVLLAAGNAVWVFLDHSTPAWDQSTYLSDALLYRQGWAVDGIHGLLSAIDHVDPMHGPLFPIAMVPFFKLFGNEPRSGLILNVALAPFLYVSAGQIAWIVFRNWVARLLTIFLVAMMPLLVGLNHEVLQDFTLATLATVSVLLLLMSDRFRNLWLTLGLGLAMGLGTLAKVTFPGFIAGPLVVVIAHAVLSAARERGERTTLESLMPQIGNFLAGAAVYLVVVLPWYLPHLSATAEYVRSTTSGPLSEGVGPVHPLTFHAIASFTTGMVNLHLSWVIALAGLIAIALAFPSLLALLRRRPLDLDRVAGLAVLLAWAIVPYIALATAHNQDVRLMAPAMVAMAIIVAGAISYVRQTWARAALIAIPAVLLVYQNVNHVTPITPGFLPGDLALSVGGYEAMIPLDDRQIGFQRLPGDDLGTPVIERVEQIARSETRGFGPRTLCMLETEPVINGNTMRFLSLQRGDPFAIEETLVGPGGTRELRETLEGCDFALYVKQPKPDPETAGERIVIVNEPYAANHMTPSLFKVFRGTRSSVPITPPGESSGGGSRVWVLVREPSGRVPSTSSGAAQP
jgi:hypothetical protein